MARAQAATRLPAAIIDRGHLARHDVSRSTFLRGTAHDLRHTAGDRVDPAGHIGGCLSQIFGGDIDDHTGIDDIVRCIGNAAPLSPKAELAWWYQFYFATERGRIGYAQNRHDFSRLIWQTASPQWHFDDATYERSAKSFDNPDHVAIVIHNYRWRLGLAEGEARYDATKATLAAAPAIAVPTITMEGDANGAPHPEPAAYRARFTGRYEHRPISGGIGHNLPQEAPAAFADAMLAIARMA